MFTGSRYQWQRKFYSCVSIFIFCLLIIPKLSQAVGINLEGKTSFDGIPSGVIRDLEVLDKVVYVAAENGVFEVVGNEAEKLEFNSFSDATGIISDIDLGDECLWVVEYGVGVFKVNLGTRETNQVYSDSDWSKSVWAMAVTPTHFFFSIIDDVIVVDRKTGRSTRLNTLVQTFKLNSVYSLSESLGNIYIASDKGYVSVSGNLAELEENKLSSKFPMLSSVTLIKESDGELFLGGPEGLYIKGDSVRFIPTEGTQGTFIHDVVKNVDGKIWLSDGRLLVLDEGELKAPSFMNPILASEAIRSVTKIAAGPYNSLLVASSQLGLISLPKSKSATNLVSLDGGVLRENILKMSIAEAGTLVRTDKGLYQLNESNGELTVKTKKTQDGAYCSTWQEEVFSKLINVEPDLICNTEYAHYIEVNTDTFYFYYDDGESASYYLIADNTILDKIEAPRQILGGSLLSGGEIAAFDVFDNVHFQLSKFNWRTIKAEEGKWFGIQCLVEFEESYLVCTSGAGLKSIDKKTGSVSTSTILGVEKLRFIRGAIVTKSGSLWVASNMGLFIKHSDYEKASIVGAKFGLFDTDFEYKSFEELTDKILVKGDKYSYLLDEKEILGNLEATAIEGGAAVLTRVQWIDDEGQHTGYFPKTSSFKFDSSFKEVTFNFVVSTTYDESSGFKFRLDDDAWVSHNKTALNLTLGDIGVGHHKLDVTVVAPNGSELGSTIQFEIAPPIWASYTGYTIYTLLTAVFICLWKIGFISKVYGHFKTTTLYKHLTRYEITDGQSKFEKMLRSKERFISEITHELRTPIQVIKGSLENISDSAKESSKELICVQNNMKRVEQLINQMSDGVPKTVDAADYYKSYSLENVKFIALSLEPLAKQKRQNLEVRIKGKKEVSLINDSLEKILANLVQNAIKFTPEQGTIKVAATQDAKVLKIVVSDDGEGIEDHLHSKVFERFARGNTDQEGSGVGLAMVKTLVELNQGNIVLDSKKGVGTKITVTLPIDDIDYVNSHAEDLSPSNVKTNKKSLLIVDDSREFRSHLFDLFSDKYRCLVARSGVQALEVMQHYLVDLVITDQMMKEMDGLTLTKSIRSNTSYANIPVLMLTAKTGAELEKAALEEKVDYFLAKPASNEEIILRVEHLLSVREAKEKEEQRSDQPVFKFGCLKIPEFNNEKDMAFYLNFIAVLEKNYHDESFSRNQAASELLISPRSLNRRMSELFEYNFSEFLSRFRIEKSIPLLLEGNSILDTCLDVGFGTAAYFSTSFKKVMLLPPKKFVEQYNKNVA
ncbi:ATP-binding protein [Alteromonas gracilis]|uniref:hybrid sensor histidine kinase/response regulator transcription factor n=1 Tax=Alteromonas gracilis TaxID=1479524 RepID=UPI003736A181